MEVDLLFLKMLSHGRLEMLFPLLVFFILPLFIYSASIERNVEECPVNNNYCVCSEGPFFNIQCKNISDFNIFYEVVSNFSDKTFIFEIGLVNWTSFPTDVLQNPYLKSMVISNSTFHRLFNASGSSNLNNDSALSHLSLENVTISHEWSWRQLNVLKGLDIFFSYNTTIGEVVPSNFSQHVSKTLKFFSVSQSNLSIIEPESLMDLKNLTYMRISHSKLRILSRDIFPSPSRLGQLRLDHNSIATLPDDMFENMPDLSVVSLSNNRISVLSEEIFRPLWRSNIYIELRNNPIKCDCRMKWILTTPDKPNIIGECAHPKKLFGKEIMNLNETDLSC